MVKPENLTAAAARAEALYNEVANLYNAACTPYGTPFSARELHEMAEGIGRTARRLKEMAASLNDNNNKAQRYE